MQEYLDLLLDTFLDSLYIFIFAFILYMVLSFFEGKVASLLEKKKKFAPALGSLVGVVPQCGIAVVASDLYIKEHITLGTLVAIFVACSDEALPILFTNFNGNWYMAFALIGIKIVGGFIFGYLIDFIYRKGQSKVNHHLEHCEEDEGTHYGCCGHEIEGDNKESPLKEHLLHPLWHSIKIFIYAFVISYLFGCIFTIWIGEENFTLFLEQNYYFTPLASVVVGLIPNCASSVLISEMYVSGALPFGALVTGLVTNAGLGPLFLFKNKKTWKQGLIIEGILILIGLILGYAFIWVTL